jgi:hypothetical protein
MRPKFAKQHISKALSHLLEIYLSLAKTKSFLINKAMYDALYAIVGWANFKDPTKSNLKLIRTTIFILQKGVENAYLNKFTKVKSYTPSKLKTLLDEAIILETYLKELYKKK